MKNYYFSSSLLSFSPNLRLYKRFLFIMLHRLSSLTLWRLTSKQLRCWTTCFSLQRSASTDLWVVTVLTPSVQSSTMLAHFWSLNFVRYIYISWVLELDTYNSLLFLKIRRRVQLFVKDDNRGSQSIINTPPSSVHKRNWNCKSKYSQGVIVMDFKLSPFFGGKEYLLSSDVIS